MVSEGHLILLLALVQNIPLKRPSGNERSWLALRASPLVTGKLP